MSRVHIALPITPPDSPTLPACDSFASLPANFDRVTCIDPRVTNDVSPSDNTMPFGNTKHSPPALPGDQSAKLHKRHARLWNDEYPPIKRKASFTPYWIRVKSQSEQDSELRTRTDTHSPKASVQAMPAGTETSSTTQQDSQAPPADAREIVATPRAPAKAKLRHSAFVNFRTRVVPAELPRVQREKKILRVEKNHANDGRPLRPNGGALLRPVVRPVEVCVMESPRAAARTRPNSLLLNDVQPVYEQPHFGDSCTAECLDHVLECGHKVFTAEPEPCATNCHIREAPDYAQPKDLDACFVCFSCIVEHLQQRHALRVADFKAECEDRAMPYEVIAQKIRLMRDGWRSQDIEEVLVLSTKGRNCEAIWIDPDYQELVSFGIDARQQKKSRRSSVTSLASTAPTTAPSNTSTPTRESGSFGQQPPPSPALSAATTASTSRTPLRQSVQSLQSLFKGRSQRSQSAAREQLEDEAWSTERTPESSPAQSEVATLGKNGTIPAETKVVPWWKKAGKLSTSERQLFERDKKAE